MIKKYEEDYKFDGIPMDEALRNAYYEGYIDGGNDASESGVYEPDDTYRKSNTYIHIMTVLNINHFENE